MRITIKRRELVPLRRDFAMDMFITKTADSKTTVTSRNLMELFSFHINQQSGQSFNPLPVVAHANVLIGLMLVVVMIDDGNADSGDIQYLSEDVEGD